MGDCKPNNHEWYGITRPFCTICGIDHTDFLLRQIEALQQQVDRLQGGIQAAEAVPRDGDYGAGWDDCLECIEGKCNG